MNIPTEIYDQRTRQVQDEDRNTMLTVNWRFRTYMDHDSRGYEQGGLAISDKKIIPRNRIDETIGLFRQNSGCSAELKIPGFRSEPFCRGEKCAEFRSEPFHGRKNNSEFRSVEQNRSSHLEFCSEPFRGKEQL